MINYQHNNQAINSYDKNSGSGLVVRAKGYCTSECALYTNTQKHTLLRTLDSSCYQTAAINYVVILCIYILFLYT